MFKAILLTFALAGIEEAKRGDYDVALPLLSFSESAVTKELHYQFYFYKACGEFQSLKKQEALASIKKFYASFGQPPTRYSALIYAMQHDLDNWGKYPLADITRKMGDVSRRLEQSRAGEITQEKQNEIVKDLERLIKEQEDNAKSQAQKQEEKEEAERNRQAKTKPKEGQIDKPAPESIVMGGPPSKGIVDDKKIRQIGEAWGTMPPAKRAQVIKELTAELPPKFEPMIRNYFAALDKMNRKP